VTNSIGNVAVIVANARVLFYPAIYISHYDVVRKALVGFGQRIVAKFKHRQP